MWDLYITKVVQAIIKCIELFLSSSIADLFPLKAEFGALFEVCQTTNL